MSHININIHNVCSDNHERLLGETKVLNAIASRPIAVYQSNNASILTANDYGLLQDITYDQSQSTDLEGIVLGELGIQKATGPSFQLAPSSAQGVVLLVNFVGIFDTRYETNAKSIGLSPLLTGGDALLGACDSIAVTSSGKPSLSANFIVYLRNGLNVNCFSVVGNAQNPAQSLESYLLRITTV